MRAEARGQLTRLRGVILNCEGCLSYFLHSIEHQVRDPLELAADFAAAAAKAEAEARDYNEGFKLQAGDEYYLSSLNFFAPSVGAAFAGFWGVRWLDCAEDGLLEVLRYLELNLEIDVDQCFVDRTRDAFDHVNNAQACLIRAHASLRPGEDASFVHHLKATMGHIEAAALILRHQLYISRLTRTLFASIRSTT